MNPVKDITDLTWQELEALPKEITILFLTYAPIEEHSHHLPLGVDIILGETWKKGAIELILKNYPDWHILTMPFIPFAQGAIKGFPGNLHFKQQTIYQVAYELLDAISSWGIQHMVVVASHGEPKHLIAIEEACERINQKRGVCAISPMGAFFSYDELGIDLGFQPKLKEQLQKYPTDFHAGWLETSAMLDVDPGHVRTDYDQLPDIRVEEKEMIFPNKVNRKIAGYGHIGFPRLADPEIGGMINHNMSQYLYKATMAFAERKDYQIYQHHSLYKLPFLKTHFKRNVFRIVAFLLFLTFLLVTIVIHIH